MFELKEVYERLPLPSSQNPNSFSAEAIKGYENHRIAKDISNNPSLLILISEQNHDFLVKNQNLFNIQVTHNLTCEIASKNEISFNNFSVVSYIGQDDDVKDLFLNTCQILIKTLGKSPSNKEIKNTVLKFIELFRALKETPRNTIQGLWCELFLIEQSSFPEKLIAGWHSTPEEKFDFSFGKLHIEVKSSLKESRLHHFSARQLNPVNDAEIIIASILLSTNVSGLSINDLLIRINKNLRNHYKLKEKLYLLVYSTLGKDFVRVNHIKFDLEFAKNSLLFFQSDNIPKIQDVNIPKEVSNVKFTSDLVNTNPISLCLDDLLMSHINYDEV